MARKREGMIIERWFEPNYTHEWVSIDNPSFKDLQFVELGQQYRFAEAAKMAQESPVRGHVATAPELVAYLAADERHWFWLRTEPRKGQYTITSTAALFVPTDDKRVIAFDEEISGQLNGRYALPGDSPLVTQAVARAAATGRVVEAPSRYKSQFTPEQLLQGASPLVTAALTSTAQEYARLHQRNPDQHPATIDVVCNTAHGMQKRGSLPDTVYVGFVGIEAYRDRCELSALVDGPRADVVLVRKR